MYTRESIALCEYRLEKAHLFLQDAKKTLELEMYDSTANRSYYSVFHATRAVLALAEIDSKKHSGVIRHFQKEYIKTNVFDKRLSEIITHAFRLRTQSDYQDFYIVAKEDVAEQVADAEYFYNTIYAYVQDAIKTSE